MSNYSDNNDQGRSQRQGRETAGNTSAKKPSHIAYQVKDAGERSYFNNIGSAFEHKDGKGFNLKLDAVPVDGRITLRSFEEKVRAVKDRQRSNSKDMEQER